MGKTIRGKKSDYFKKLGEKGGKATIEKHGKKHFSRIGKIGGKSTRDKYSNKNNDKTSLDN